MAFTYNTENNNIKMEPGDTGGFTVEMEWPDISSPVALVLGVCDKSGEDVVLKNWLFENGKVNVRFCNHDTRDLDPGKYSWQMRIVTDPEYDDAGNVIVNDCDDHVISAFDGDKLPRFVITRKGARV